MIDKIDASMRWTFDDEVAFVRSLPGWVENKNKASAGKVVDLERILLSYLKTIKERRYWPFCRDLKMLEEVVTEVMFEHTE